MVVGSPWTVHKQRVRAVLVEGGEYRERFGFGEACAAGEDEDFAAVTQIVDQFGLQECKPAALLLLQRRLGPPRQDAFLCGTRDNSALRER